MKNLLLLSFVLFLTINSLQAGQPVLYYHEGEFIGTLQIADGDRKEVTLVKPFALFSFLLSDPITVESASAPVEQLMSSASWSRERTIFCVTFGLLILGLLTVFGLFAGFTWGTYSGYLNAAVGLLFLLLHWYGVYMEVESLGVGKVLVAPDNGTIYLAPLVSTCMALAAFWMGILWAHMKKQKQFE